MCRKMSMKRVILVLSILIFAACSNDVKLTLISQEEKIDSYISTTFRDSTVVRNNGSNRVVLSRNESEPMAEKGDYIHFYYAGYVFNNSPSMIFATNLEAVAEQSGLVVTNPDYSVMKATLSDGELIPGLVYGLEGVHQGEHCIILFAADLGFGAQKQYNIPRLSALAYEIWVERVIKQ